MKIAFIAYFFYAMKAGAAETYAYKILSSDFVEKKNSIVEIGPSTPVKSQDGIGFCYGLSSTSLLETLRCKEMNLDCRDPKNFLSTFDVTSHYKNGGLEEGGQASHILSHIASSNHKLAFESCARFSTLVHQIQDNNRIVTKNERQALDYLTKVWTDFKKSSKENDCTTCLADAVKNRLGNSKTPAGQIEDAFQSSKSLEEFLYKTILPAECLNESKMATVPDFSAQTYPSLKETFDENKLKEKIVALLSSGIPVEIGICADKTYTENCQNRQGHSIALYGIKEVCHKKTNECRKLVKVKNSYGEGWQKRFNDGWLDMETLVKSSVSFATFDNISWIESKQNK